MYPHLMTSERQVMISSHASDFTTPSLSRSSSSQGSDYSSPSIDPKLLDNTTAEGDWPFEDVTACSGTACFDGWPSLVPIQEGYVPWQPELDMSLSPSANIYTVYDNMEQDISADAKQMNALRDLMAHPHLPFSDGDAPMIASAMLHPEHTTASPSLDKNARPEPNHNQQCHCVCARHRSIMISEINSIAVSSTSKRVRISRARQSEREKRRHTCTFVDCEKTFMRPSDLSRHKQDVHALAQQYYECEASSSCTYQTRRKDKMKEHCQKMHGHAKGRETFATVVRGQDDGSEVDGRPSLPAAKRQKR